MFSLALVLVKTWTINLFSLRITYLNSLCWWSLCMGIMNWGSDCLQHCFKISDATHYNALQCSIASLSPYAKTLSQASSYSKEGRDVGPIHWWEKCQIIWICVFKLPKFSFGQKLITFLLWLSPNQKTYQLMRPLSDLRFRNLSSKSGTSIAEAPRVEFHRCSLFWSENLWEKRQVYRLQNYSN